MNDEADHYNCFLEIHAGGQEYIEDCEVCCRPIKIIYEVEGGYLSRFEYQRLDD